MRYARHSATKPPTNRMNNNRTAPQLSSQAMPGERRKWWVFASIGVGTFMSGLDASIVNAVLPVMGGGLHTSVAHIEWVVTIYLLVISGVLLGFGRLGDLRGHKRVFVTGFAGFMVS